MLCHEGLVLICLCQGCVLCYVSCRLFVRSVVSEDTAKTWISENWWQFLHVALFSLIHGTTKDWLIELIIDGMKHITLSSGSCSSIKHWIIIACRRDIEMRAQSLHLIVTLVIAGSHCLSHVLLILHWAKELHQLGVVSRRGIRHFWRSHGVNCLI